MEATTLLELGDIDFVQLILSYIVVTNVIFIPALILVGMFLKSIDKIDNQYIRILLAIFGIVLIVVKDGIGMDSLIQGIYVSGASVLLYDIKHNVFSKKEVKEYVTTDRAKMD